MTYIDSVAGHRDEDGLRWGVESVCAQLNELGAELGLRGAVRGRADWDRAIAWFSFERFLGGFFTEPHTVAPHRSGT